MIHWMYVYTVFGCCVPKCYRNCSYISRLFIAPLQYCNPSFRYISKWQLNWHCVAAHSLIKRQPNIVDNACIQTDENTHTFPGEWERIRVVESYISLWLLIDHIPEFVSPTTALYNLQSKNQSFVSSLFCSNALCMRCNAKLMEDKAVAVVIEVQW